MSTNMRGLLCEGVMILCEGVMIWVPAIGFVSLRVFK